MQRAEAEGVISVTNAVKVEIVRIEFPRFRSPKVQVRWTVLNQEPELKWLHVGETLLSHINVDINPEV